jgi:hypothetical protein
MGCCSCSGNSCHESNQKKVKESHNKPEESKAALKKKAETTEDIT